MTLPKTNLPKVYSVELSKKAFKQLQKINDSKVRQKIKIILDELSVNPYSVTNKFERLKGDLTGYCSKRISDKDRIVYQVLDDKILVFVISVQGHYNDH